MKLLSITLFFYLFTFSICAQNDKDLKNADKKFNNFAYIDARAIYLDVAKSGYKSENLFKKLGDSYYFNNELSNSLEWYQELYNFQKNIEPIYLFRYAMALKSINKYDEANKILLEYYKNSTNSQAPTETLKQTKEELINLNSGKYKITTIDVNSSFSDYAPAYYMSKLVFVSNRKIKDKSNQQNSQWNNQPYSDLYFVNLKRDNSLDNRIEPFEKTINSPLHESSATFTKDFKTIYFSRNNFNKNNYKTNLKGVNLVKIYKSVKGDDDKWKTPEELPFNSNEFSCAHPALSQDEKKIYFSSDMPGTLGMSDIYVSDVYADGTYGAPVNLGNKINTAGRESYPFIDKKNRFFFSSDGHNGLGGFDIFVTELKPDNSVSEILNLGSPMNGSTDDFSLIVDTADDKGFFASNRSNGAGSDDIYEFTLTSDLIASCKQHVTGNVSDQKFGKPLANITVKTLDMNLNTVGTTVTDANGDYKFDLDCNSKSIIRISGDNIATTEQPIVTDSSFEKQLRQQFNVTEGDNLGRIKANYGEDISKILQLDAIYFDFDMSTIRFDAEVELQKIISFLRMNNNTYLDVRSFTDSQGSRDYNINLSERRTKATIDYIVKAGISKSRLSGRGYGDTRLMNGCSHGVECSEAQHQLNRRSEFILSNKKNALNEVVSSNDNYINLDVKDPNLKVRQVVEQSSNDNSRNDSQANGNQISSEVVATNPIVKQNSTSNDTVVVSDVTPKYETNSEIDAIYDFTSSEAKYSIQLISIKEDSNVSYPTLKTTFKHAYSDGLIRYFTGVFSNMQDAINYKNLIKSKKGIKDAFIIILKGEERL